MIMLKNLSIIVLLIFSTAAFAEKDAIELSAEYGLNTEEAIINGFHEHTESIRIQLGRRAWQELQSRALKAIDESDFEYFDPLVRETSCELRALFGIHVSRRLELQTADAGRKQTAEDKLTDDEQDLSTLIYVLSHALITRYGEDGFGADDQNDKKKLIQFLLESAHLKIGSTKADSLIKDLEKAVAFGSVMFARRLAEQLDNEIGYQLRSLFIKRCIFDDPDRGRAVVSSFGRCQLCLEIVRAYKIPFVIRTRLSEKAMKTPSHGTIVAVYQYVDNRLKTVNPNLIEDGTVVLAVDAVTKHFDALNVEPNQINVVDYIEKLDLEDAWLCGCAAHSQFAGKHKYTELGEAGGNLVVADHANRLKNCEAGITREDPQRQSVDHVYVATFGRAKQYAGRRHKEQPASLWNGFFNSDPHSLKPFSNAWYYPAKAVAIEPVHAEVPAEHGAEEL